MRWYYSFITRNRRRGGDAGEDFIHALGGDRFEREAAQDLREAGVAHFTARDVDVNRLGGGFDGNHGGEIIAHADECECVFDERSIHLPLGEEACV